MKRNFIIVAFALMALLSSCGKNKIVGTWIQSSANQGGSEVGFALYKDGTASAINMRMVVFEKWNQDSDLLIISGRNTGSLNNSSFVDTMRIVKVTKEELVLSQEGFEDLVYTRKK